MALHEDTVWEIRTTGSQNNGGGFYDRNPGTSVDYSQQAAAQLSLTDLACLAATPTTLTSATGGFTAAMVGNIIHIVSGTNFTPGWYEVTAYSDTNTVTLDRGCVSGGDGSSGVGNVGGAFALGGSLDHEFFSAFVKGNTCYVGGGNHAQLIEHVQPAQDGDDTHAFWVIGYKTTRGDFPKGDDRPLIDCDGAHFRTVGDNWVLMNLRFTGVYDDVVVVSGYASLVFNCKATNTDADTFHHGFLIDGSATHVVACEASSAGTGSGSSAFKIAADARLVGCFAHDSVMGFFGTTGGAANESAILWCVAANCTKGIYFGATHCTIMNNTIYNCTDGIYFYSEGTSALVLNNIVDACTNGINCNSGSTTCMQIFALFNCVDATTPFTYVTNLLGNLLVDPGLENPASDNFSIRENDPVYEQACEVGQFTGATV